MHDLKTIRANPDAFDAALAKRGVEPQAENVLQQDASLRQLLTDRQDVQTKRKALSKDIGAAMGQGDKEKAEQLKAEVANLKTQLESFDDTERQQSASLQELLAGIPNLAADNAPDGASEDDNVFLHKWGDIPQFDFEPQAHEHIGNQLQVLDKAVAAQMSGSRFAVLKGPLARLERALGQYMLDVHVNEFDYTEISPPLLVRDNALFGTGQLPKFEEDQFKTTAGHYLIPTAEVSVTNLVADKILLEDELPLRFAALTPCFRSEAGSAGKDTTGLIRLHQFYKVELVHISTPIQDELEYQRLNKAVETILQRLELPYKAVALCTGDLGFSAEYTTDYEVWFPSQNTYREISSCSRFGAFQARRMNARFRPAEQSKGTEFVHTFNGSGLAVGRALAAIMENYQNADGSIRIPTVLQPYMNSQTIIRKST